MAESSNSDGDGNDLLGCQLRAAYGKRYASLRRTRRNGGRFQWRDAWQVSLSRWWIHIPVSFWPSTSIGSNVLVICRDLFNNVVGNYSGLGVSLCRGYDLTLSIFTSSLVSFLSCQNSLYASVIFPLLHYLSHFVEDHCAYVGLFFKRS